MQEWSHNRKGSGVFGGSVDLLIACVCGNRSTRVITERLFSKSFLGIESRFGFVTGTTYSPKVLDEE